MRERTVAFGACAWIFIPAAMLCPPVTTPAVSSAAASGSLAFPSVSVAGCICDLPECKPGAALLCPAKSCANTFFGCGIEDPLVAVCGLPGIPEDDGVCFFEEETRLWAGTASLPSDGAVPDAALANNSANELPCIAPARVPFPGVAPVKPPERSGAGSEG
jgi:hypothetical protein